MQLYRYQAAKADGAIVRGLLEAPSSGEAGVALMERGLHPLQVTLTDSWEGRRKAAGRRELAIVFRSIAALVAAGVPVERAVGASEAVARGALRNALAESRSQLRAGRSLAQALEGARGTVPSIVTGMLRAGERGSQLGRALEQVATHLEQEADLIGRVQQALAYPLLLAVAGTASVLLIGTVIVPKFVGLLADLGEELPASTRMLLAASSLVTSHGLMMVAVIAAGAWIMANWIRGPKGGLAWDRLLLGTPFVGPVRHTLATARASRALSGMLHSAMPILPALDTARDASGDRAVAQRIARARERVASGQPLAPSLERERALSSNALQLVSVGESSGQLAAMSGRAGDLAAQEADRALRTLVGLLEPALVVFFGGVVAFVAAALLQAVYSIRPGGA